MSNVEFLKMPVYIILYLAQRASSSETWLIGMNLFNQDGYGQYFVDTIDLKSYENNNDGSFDGQVTMYFETLDEARAVVCDRLGLAEFPKGKEHLAFDRLDLLTNLLWNEL